MSEITGQRSYWRHVFVRAFDDALSFLGINRRKAILGLLTTSIAAAALAYWFSPQKAADKLIWMGLVLAAFWTLFVLVYIPFLIRTPYVLFAEQRESLDAQVEELTTDKATLESDRDTLTEEVTKARTANPHSNFQKKELQKLIDRFQRLITNLENGQQGAIKQFYSADTAAKNFIDKEFSSYTEYGAAFPVQNTHTTKVKYDQSDFDQYSRICTDRVARLEELLGHFS